MKEDFNCISVNGNMFSMDMLRRISDLDTGLEGTEPTSYATGENRRSLDSLIGTKWTLALHYWGRLGKQARDGGERSKSRGWIRRLFDECMDIDLGTSTFSTSEGLPDIWREWRGTLWHVVGMDAPLDVRSDAVGSKRVSPHALAQGQLNRSDKHIWGVVSNGLSLRLLRSSNRPSFYEHVEFDLELIFEESHYQDFRLLFLLLHQSRWPKSVREEEDCFLDIWYSASSEAGVSALDELRNCVRSSAECLGSGLVRRAAGNRKLRDRLRDDESTAGELQGELMWLVYRMIFIFVCEDKGVLPLSVIPEDGDEVEMQKARGRYLEAYSTSRRREKLLSTRPDEHSDAYEELKVVMRSLYSGENRLALPGLGSELFSPETTPTTDQGRIGNRDFLRAMKKLCYFRREGNLHKVHWRSLKEEELGSIYESLLEYQAHVDLERGSFELRVGEGNERHSSGSHYTPSELVQHLVESTVEPVLEEVVSTASKATSDEEDGVRRQAKIDEILNLKICDPACGSGHFLVAAVNRIAVELARTDTGEEHPGYGVIQKWKRVVASRCIYGVDLNPLAVGLCKVSIWMNTVGGEQPLSFLDAHIKHGNSLSGLRVNWAGIIHDNAVAKAWKESRKRHISQNKKIRKEVLGEPQGRLDKIDRDLRAMERDTGQASLFEGGGSASGREGLLQEKADLQVLIKQREVNLQIDYSTAWSGIPIRKILDAIEIEWTNADNLSDESPELLDAKKSEIDTLKSDPKYLWASELFDAMLATWWWDPPNRHHDDDQLAVEELGRGPLTTGDIQEYSLWLANQLGLSDSEISSEMVRRGGRWTSESRWGFIRKRSAEISRNVCFFHWDLEFPGVFLVEEPGFDAVIGNPPFLGGAKISGASSVEFANFLRSEYSGKAKADLAAYFYRLSFDNIEEGGRVGMVATNTIGQGATRECGLQKIVEGGGVITDVKTDIVWPGDASVTVDLVTFEKR